MIRSGKGLVLQDLDRLLRRGTVPSGDGALLDRFLSRGDESAFEALVGRHGPMVRGVCRRLLASPHDADDAFQATFLVLVRKGGRLRDPDRLGPWLHGVATREALKTRAARRGNQSVLDVPACEGANANAEWSDVMPIIDDELARLPAKHREVLVACLLDGATVEEASQRLDCPVGTVKSRLSRAREALRARLTSRGVAPAVAVAILSAESKVFAFPVSSRLIRATLAAAAASAAPGVASLLTGVAPTMLSKSTLSAVVVIGLGAAGLAASAWDKPSQAQVHKPPAERPRAAAAARESEEARNLREIVHASADYAAKKGSFPAPAIYGADGRPLLSWRVAILPFLGHEELYKKFHLGESWDSPHNKALIEQMPAVFQTPASPAPRGQTRFRGFAGEGAVFDPSLGPDGLAMGGGMMRGGGMVGGGGAPGMMGRGAPGMMGRGMMGRGMMGRGMMAGRGLAAEAENRDGLVEGRAERKEEPGRDDVKAPRGDEEESSEADAPDAEPRERNRRRGGFRPGGPQGFAAPGGGMMGGGGMGAMMGMMSGMMGGGPSSMGTVRRGVSQSEITDGASYTILAVEARDATPWTKPGELPFVTDQELPALDDHDPRGYLIGFCHGDVRLLKKDHANLSMLLTSLLTRAGGEVISMDVFADEAQPAAVAAPVPLTRSPAAASSSPSPSVEDRLRTVEEKLDRLLKQLEAR